MKNKEKIIQNIKQNDSGKELYYWKETQNNKIEWQRKGGIIDFVWDDDNSFYIRFTYQDEVKNKSELLELNDNYEKVFLNFTKEINEEFFKYN